LISIPQLDLAGCKGTYGEGVMKVFDIEGKLILKGIMDDSGLYAVRIPKISHIKAMKTTIKTTSRQLNRTELDNSSIPELNDVKLQSKVQDKDFDYKTAPINEIADRIMKFDKVFINAEMR